MARLKWNEASRDYHMGVSHGVMYLQNPDGTYASGVVWNGLKSVTEIQTEGEISKIYADNMRYGSLRAHEGLSGRIEVYDYPYELSLCNGFREPEIGMRINLQKRRSFGLCYQTKVSKKDYIIHIIYAINLNPGEYTYKAINESPEATVFAWDFFTIPSKYDEEHYAASLTIDTRKATPEKMQRLEDILYGTDDTDPTLPTIDELVRMNIEYEIRPILVHAIATLGIWVWDTFYFPNDSVPRAVHREAETRVTRKTSVPAEKRPGITYDVLYDPLNPYPGTNHFAVTSNIIPTLHDSVTEVIEDIPRTTLIDTIPSTDGYVFNDYSIYYKEET